MNGTRARTLAARTAAASSALALLAAGGAAGQASDWCRDAQRDEDRHCEVREMTLPASGSLIVDAAPNGGIHVSAWDRDEVHLEARIATRARDEVAARDLAGEISISTRGRVEADGPAVRRGESWSVSYRIRVPASYDLDLASVNGGIEVAGVRGELRLETTNGGIGLTEVAGDVRARTTNGGLDLVLTGSRWDGEGLDARTTNGGVELAIPEGYSARLETGTRNGGLRVDFPITVSGRIGRSLTAELGSGGAPVRALTTNGGVSIRRSG